LGWEPQGTVLYKPSNPHPELVTLSASDLPEGIFIQCYLDESGELQLDRVIQDEDINITVLYGPGDMALSFEQATRSREIDPEWEGDYCGNCGQIITTSDAASIAAALRQSVEAGEWGKNSDWIQELIALLEAGEVRIL
jgi:hypothetical protein